MSPVGSGAVIHDPPSSSAYGPSHPHPRSGLNVEQNDGDFEQECTPRECSDSQKTVPLCDFASVVSCQTVAENRLPCFDSFVPSPPAASPGPQPNSTRRQRNVRNDEFAGPGTELTSTWPRSLQDWPVAIFLGPHGYSLDGYIYFPLRPQAMQCPKPSFPIDNYYLQPCLPAN